MALYTRAGEQTGLKAGDVIAFDLGSRTICINRPPLGTLRFGANGVPDDSKEILSEMASNPRSAFEVANLLAHVAGLKAKRSEVGPKNPDILLFDLVP